VNDSADLRCRKGVSHLDPITQGLIHGQARLGQTIGQSDAFNTSCAVNFQRSNNMWFIRVRPW
jgi:hypothetical protein